MLRFSLVQAFVLCLLWTDPSIATTNSCPKCRTQPGDPSFPTKDQLARFNSSVDGRLISVVPSAEVCKTLPGGCTDAEWFNADFRNDIPGSMLQYNWEQDYTSNPPSLCFRNGTVCGQGSVPILGVNATSAAHIQAGVRFAQAYNMKVAIKSSGHDYLGRSTAKNSFLLWTRYFQNITFHDSFEVGGKNKGSAVTVGSGVGLHTIYQAAKAQGKIFVGGTAETVVAAGGYVQGAGHSALSPTYGLAADNTLEFEIVIADGNLVTANEVSNPDLFWALRGGGAGSWGVVISATFRTFPTFNAVHHQAIIVANTSAEVGELAMLHAQHIFDWDNVHASQYFYWQATPPTFTWTIDTIFPNMSSIAAANASLAPFLHGVSALGFSFESSTDVMLVNDLLSLTMDEGGALDILGSRLFSADVYRHKVKAIGKAYQVLFDGGATGVLGNLVAGGQVTQKVDSAVTPAWRTAKAHVIVTNDWSESTPPDEVEALREDMTNNKVPILDALAGPGSGAYSNEADLREPHFQTTFFGPNYARLSAIKDVYDPQALFIVGAGVGSEKWDAEGICRVAS